MNMTKLKSILAVIASVLIFISTDALFTVKETEQGLVTQFGNVKRVLFEPGLHIKIPLVQQVNKYDKRVLSLDPPVEPIILSDRKRLLVDTVVRYKIEDPLQFYKSVGNNRVLMSRLGAILNSSTRDVLGKYTLSSMLTSDRDIVMEDITRRVRKDSKGLGIMLIDVRVRRADLPDETSQSVYKRMRAERDREAREHRAEGHEISERIKASADKEAAKIISDAKRKAQIIKADADKEKYRIMRASMSKDPSFSEFYILMDSYRDSIKDNNTSLILSSKMPYFKYFAHKASR